jgi:hypothetical protein
MTVESPKKQRLTSEEKRQVEKLYRSGVEVRDIAAELGRPISMIIKRIEHIRDDDAGNLSKGIFLIGLAVLLATGGFWPGVLFLWGLSSFVHKAIAKRDLAKGIESAVWPVWLGIAFSVPGELFLPSLLVMGGVAALITYMIRMRAQPLETEKRKNEELLRMARDDDSDYEKPKRGAMRVRLTDDGELVDDFVDDEGIVASNRAK